MRKLKIYLDNCCYNRPYDDQSQIKVKLETEAKLYLQQCVLDGVVELAWSYVLDYENSNNPYKEKRDKIAAWRSLSKHDCEENEEILSVAGKFISVGIKKLDALHLSSAVFLNADYFISTDYRLLAKRDLICDIKIVNPAEFIIMEANV